jgi:hypothetical protein
VSLMYLKLGLLENLRSRFCNEVFWQFQKQAMRWIHLHGQRIRMYVGSHLRSAVEYVFSYTNDLLTLRSEGFQVDNRWRSRPKWGSLLIHSLKLDLL